MGWDGTGSDHVGYGLVWSGLVWSGLAWPGLAWPGLAWPGLACSARLAWPGLAWPGLACSARLGLARLRPAPLRSAPLRSRIMSCPTTKTPIPRMAALHALDELIHLLPRGRLDTSVQKLPINRCERRRMRIARVHARSRACQVMGARARVVQHNMQTCACARTDG